MPARSILLSNFPCECAIYREGDFTDRSYPCLSKEKTLEVVFVGESEGQLERSIPALEIM